MFGFTYKKMGAIALIAGVVWASNNVDAVGDVIGD